MSPWRATAGSKSAPSIAPAESQDLGVRRARDRVRGARGRTEAAFEATYVRWNAGETTTKEISALRIFRQHVDQPDHSRHCAAARLVDDRERDP